jgi:hypothetical protein
MRFYFCIKKKKRSPPIVINGPKFICKIHKLLPSSSQPPLADPSSLIFLWTQKKKTLWEAMGPSQVTFHFSSWVVGYWWLTPTTYGSSWYIYIYIINPSTPGFFIPPTITTTFFYPTITKKKKKKKKKKIIIIIIIGSCEAPPARVSQP